MLLTWRLDRPLINAKSVAQPFNFNGSGIHSFLFIRTSYFVLRLVFLFFSVEFEPQMFLFCSYFCPPPHIKTLTHIHTHTHTHIHTHTNRQNTCIIHNLKTTFYTCTTYYDQRQLTLYFEMRFYSNVFLFYFSEIEAELVLKVFLILGQKWGWCSYKRCSYKKKRV